MIEKCLRRVCNKDENEKEWACKGHTKGCLRWVEEAISDIDSSKWIEAIKSEMDSI